jgi:hypothetical protein
MLSQRREAGFDMETGWNSPKALGFSSVTLENPVLKGLFLCHSSVYP